MRQTFHTSMQRAPMPHCASLALLVTAMLGGIARAQAPDAVITELRGGVRLEGVESRDARKNDGLRRGQRIRTGDGAAADLTFSDGTRVQLAERSLLVIVGEDAAPD